MNPILKFAPRTFPARVAELGFATELPADWISHDLPKEDLDVSDATKFMALAIVTAPHAAVVFAFAGRPAYDDGTLHDWTMYNLNHNQLQPRAIGRDMVAGVPAIVGEAVQPSEMGTMVVRFAFLEDGNRLINLTLTAPELFADSVQAAWFKMLQTFVLETPRGSRFKPEPQDINTPAAQIPEPWLESKPVEAAQPDSAADAVESQPAASVPIREIEMKLPADLKPKKCKFYDFALAADTTSLDPEASINANLRNKGVGLVPNVVAVNENCRYASVAAGAIVAQFDVPYGWHVIDDGKRTLVFEPSGKVQISMNLIPREGRSNQKILDEIEAQMRQDYPHPEFVRLHEGRIHALGARNIADGAQALEQYHMLYPFRDDKMVLRARVTTTPDQNTDACNLAKLILESCAFDFAQQCDEPERDPEPQPAAQKTPDGKPAWWGQALAMEAKNELEAAEKHIRENCPYIGFAYSIAEMYRLRMHRMMEAGDQKGAREAFQKSSDFIFFYASMATSGGEGAALSLERDEFRAQLVAEYGSDPEATPA